MAISEYLDPERIRLNIELRSRKHALETASELIATGDDSLSSVRLLDALLQRERLGCTATGGPVAVPRARLRSAGEPVAAFLRGTEPINFEAADGSTVEFVLAVVYPLEMQEDSREELARFAAALNNASLHTRLRNVATADEAYQALVDGLDQKES